MTKTPDDTLSQTSISEFLEELSALTRKHQIEIGGCGCCGSPFLFKGDDYLKDENGNYLKNEHGKVVSRPHVYTEDEKYVVKHGTDCLEWEEKDK